MKLKPSIWIITLTAAVFAAWGVLAMGAQSGGTGTLTGTIHFEGTAPPPMLINMARDPECVSENQGRKVYIQDGEVNSNDTLPNAFVYLKSGVTGHYTAPSTPAVLDQQGCVFVPHVLGLMVGQQLKVLNSDFTTHNVHFLPKHNPQWNESQPPGAAPLYHSFAHPEVMIPVECNVHPWMKAYVGVMTNPFYDVSGPEGTYTIKNVPAGDYTIEAWTATFGTHEQKITVRADQTTTANFTFTSH